MQTPNAEKVSALTGSRWSAWGRGNLTAGLALRLRCLADFGKVSKGREGLLEKYRQVVRRDLDRARRRFASARRMRNYPPDFPPPATMEAPSEGPSEDEDPFASPERSGIMINSRGDRAGETQRSEIQKELREHAQSGLVGGALAPNRKSMKGNSARPDPDDLGDFFSDSLEGTCPVGYVSPGGSSSRPV